MSTIKVDRDRLSAVGTNLNDAANDMADSIDKLGDAEFTSNLIVPSIRDKIEELLSSTETNMNNLKDKLASFAGDIETTLDIIKNLDDSSDDINAQGIGIFWSNQEFTSENTEGLKALILKLNEAGLMSGTSLFSTATIESPYGPNEYYPEDKESRAAWEQELIDKYTAIGYTEDEAKDKAAYEMARDEMEATGATTVEGRTISDFSNDATSATLKKQERMNTEQQEEPEQETSEDSTESTSESSTTATSTARASSSGTYQYRAQSYSSSSNSGGSTGSAIGSSSNNGGTSSGTPSETPSTPGDASTPSETPSTPETSTPSGENNGTSGPSIDEEVPTEETPSTGENTNTGDNNSGTTTTPPPTNTGESNTSTSTGNTSQSSGSNNSSGGYVSSGNNNNGYTSNAGGSFEDSTTNTGTPNENASTTTPSAPDSDAGIKDNSGETLDVISIDKDTTNSPSTSSNDGGSVIPAVLGVGVAGAAVAGGAKIIHDKKNKDEMYSYDDEESEEDNNSFSYLNSYDDSSETETQEAPATKYRAGSANKLVLEDAPENINIEESATNIPGSGEELE